MKSLVHIFAFVIINFSAYPQSDMRGLIEGTIVSREDHHPLVGANVLLQRSVLGTTCGDSGKFVLKNIPEGVYSLAISMVGYERAVIPNVQVKAGETVTFFVELKPTAIQIEPVVVTASKREQSLQEVPVSVSVLDAKELSYRNTIIFDDALRYVPGVNLTQSQVNIRGSTGYSRGVGTRVLLLVDGLPFLTGDTGEMISESLPVYQIDRIEVVKGAGSALYGSSALGGVINILTKEVGEQPETKVRMYGGLYETPKYPKWRWTDESRFFNGIYASHAQRFGDLRVFFGGSRTADEGYKRNDHWRRWNGSVHLGYDFSPFESLSLVFSLLDQRRGNFLYWKSLDSALVPEDEQLGQRVQSSRWSIGSSFKKFLSSEFFYQVKATWYRSRWEDNIGNRLDTNGNKSRSDFLNGEVQANYEAWEAQTLTFGLYGSFNTVSADTIFGKHSGYGGALYLQDEVNLTPLRFTVGGRYDLQRLEGTETVGQFNPKFGLTYHPFESTTFRLAVGRGFRAPSVAEVFTTTEAGGIPVRPNPALRPERSWSFEIGSSHSFGEDLLTELALFRNEFWDLIEPTFGTDGNVRFQNVTRARVKGYELGLQSGLFKRLLMTRIGYTYIYPEDVKKNNILKYRPRHLFYASARFEYGYVQFGIDYRFLSKVERIDEEFVTLGIITQGDKRVPISVTDVRLAAEWSFLRLPLVSSFHVNNLFGYHYVELIGNIAPIRNYVITLEAKLE